MMSAAWPSFTEAWYSPSAATIPLAPSLCVFLGVRQASQRGAANPGRAVGARCRRFFFSAKLAVAAAPARSAGEAAERSELRGRLRRHPIATSWAWTALTPSLRFPRAREAEPSAARRILAARLERGAADFSFQLNSAVAAAPARSAGGRPSAASYGVDFAATRSQHHGHGLRRCTRSSFFCWPSWPIRARPNLLRKRDRFNPFAAFSPRARGGAERGAANPGRAVGARCRRFFFSAKFGGGRGAGAIGG